MIVATVGHVDHGKTTLVRALTGVDTDRLPEEKARGMSIDLGFAYRRGVDDRLIGFVDVPGHERFIRNMLAGVSGIDLALIVVAADDGVMPQTREHLAILDLLGLKRGVVVVTKVDRVDARRTAQVLDDVQEVLAGTDLAGAPAFRTAPPTGDGVAALARYLDAELARTPVLRQCAGPARLAIDRAFAVLGSGTVVTGTVFDGQVAAGDELVVSPSGLHARVRRIRVHDADVLRAVKGERCALNLVGVGLEQVERGHWVLSASLHKPTRLLDVKLRVLAEAAGRLHERTQLQLHLGTASVAARALPWPELSLSPGMTAFARLRLDAPIVAMHGDRFVLRDSSSRRTLGGGVVLDPFASAERSKPSLRTARLRSLDEPIPQGVLRGLAGVDTGLIDLKWFATAFKLFPDQARRIVNEAGLVIVGTDSAAAISPDRLDELSGDAVAMVANHHRQHPERVGVERDRIGRAVAPRMPGCFSALLDHLVERGLVRIEGNKVRLSGHRATLGRADQTLWNRVHPKISRAGFSPPRSGELARRLSVTEGDLLRLLYGKVTQGELLKVGKDRFMLRETMARLAEIASGISQAQADGRLSVAQFRDAIGTGRGLAIDILECLDRQHVTVRVGDMRRMSRASRGVLTNGSAAAARRRQHWRYRHRFSAGAQ